jgi:hypothetical protein
MIEKYFFRHTDHITQKKQVRRSTNKLFFLICTLILKYSARVWDCKSTIMRSISCKIPRIRNLFFLLCIFTWSLYIFLYFFLHCLYFSLCKHITFFFMYHWNRNRAPIDIHIVCIHNDKNFVNWMYCMHIWWYRKNIVRFRISKNKPKKPMDQEKHNMAC